MHDIVHDEGDQPFAFAAQYHDVVRPGFHHRRDHAERLRRNVLHRQSDQIGPVILAGFEPGQLLRWIRSLATDQFLGLVTVLDPVQLGKYVLAL